MGKTKRAKNRPKVNPTGVPSLQDVEREENELGDSSSSTQENIVQTLIEQLQSPDIEEKLCGLETLATIPQNQDLLADILQQNAVKIAAPLLLDKNYSVRQFAAGALRNLSAVGEHGMCSYLVEQDVMTPLAVLIHEYAARWDPAKEKKGAADVSTDTFVQVVHLLWNLCESSSTAVKNFNEANLLPALVKCLEVSMSSPDMAIAIGHCLHAVTEDNSTAVSKFQVCEAAVQNLLQLKGDEASTVLLRTLAAGVTLNLSFGQVSSLPASTLTNLVKTLSATLATDHRLLLNGLTSRLTFDSTEEGDPKQVEEVSRAICEAQRLLEAQRTAVEILANLCSGDDAEDDMVDQDLSDTSDEVLSDYGGLEEDTLPMQCDKLPPSIPSEVYEGILSEHLVQKTWDKTILPAENVVQILKDHPRGKPLYKKLCVLRCHAYLCLNNMIDSLSLEDLGGAPNVYKMWLNIGTVIFKQTDSSNTQLLEAATAALRASLQKLAAVRSEFLHQVSQADLELMFNGEQQCTDANVRANLVRSIGTLGMVFLQSTDAPSQTLLRSVGKFLLDTCFREPELWVVAEALDTLIDVFGEDETDSAAAEIVLVDRLQALDPILRNKVRQQRKSLGAHYHLVMTVRTNLSRFIKYKAARLRGIATGCL